MTRKKSDTAAFAVEAMAEAAVPPLECPAHVRLRPEDLPFWEGITRARTREEWSSRFSGCRLLRPGYRLEPPFWTCGPPGFAGDFVICEDCHGNGRNETGRGPSPPGT